MSKKGTFITGRADPPPKNGHFSAPKSQDYLGIVGKSKNTKNAKKRTFQPQPGRDPLFLHVFGGTFITGRAETPFSNLSKKAQKNPFFDPFFQWQYGGFWGGQKKGSKNVKKRVFLHFFALFGHFRSLFGTFLAFFWGF